MDFNQKLLLLVFILYSVLVVCWGLMLNMEWNEIMAIACVIILQCVVTFPK